MSYYNVVAETSENTVVTEYKPAKKRQKNYQTEADLEKEFIKMLTEQGYDYLPIHSENDLINNLRDQMEKLNDYKFSDDEWKQFFHDCVANPNEHITEKTRKIQEDYIQVLKQDDGTSRNIRLIDKTHIQNNYLQVINQYENGKENGAKYDNRYDVTILVNGLPLVHVELKRRGVPIREAFNQIDRYQKDSFWAGCGLYEYVQIFVISNGTNTKYYSNTTRSNAIERVRNKKFSQRKTSNSFDFTSYWADAENKIIPDLYGFTQTFFCRHTLLAILVKYCVFTSENMLLVMRPYQITATERILNRIEIATNYKKYGTIAAGGYIWHTTGSGKTLTSFKAARLATQIPYIDKVLFVVDRKDLDYQTMKEYDRFEKGAANSNTSTAVLKRQLENQNAKIIITTIQKLSTFCKKNSKHPVYNKRIVIIFDECHRSQFGDMHNLIVKKFKKYYLIGFTGTPIFSENEAKGNKAAQITTGKVFGDRLHAYTIVDAINDHNVLPFRIDYIKTMEREPDMEDEKVWGIDKESAYLAPERIRLNTKYILDHFDQKTYRKDKSYLYRTLMNVSDVASAKNKKIESIKEIQRLSGFNSILATSSVEAAKLYYTEFKRQMIEDPSKKLRVAIIYSYAANEESQSSGALAEENSENTTYLDASSREFLDHAISDYNEMFGTHYDTSSEKFQNYYKDVSLRMKNREIDLLIVVNMFLTGFDAPTLNTLWVDKNLKMHGLIQAFSRTNRILNSVKTFGNIVCFRNLQKQVDEAISLFGDKNASDIVLMKRFTDYYNGYEENGKYNMGYAEMIDQLCNKFPLTNRIIGEKDQKTFVILFGAVLRMRNLLSSFDDFKGKEIISQRDFQDYMGKYQDIRDSIITKEKTDKVSIADDLVFETELIRQLEVNIDYILMLVETYKSKNEKKKEMLINIRKAVGSSSELRSKKELIDNFIVSIDQGDDVKEAWKYYVKEHMEKDLEQIVKEENLKPEETRKFIYNSLEDGFVKENGTGIDSLMPPMSRFGKKNSRAQKKLVIIDKLKNFCDTYSNIAVLDA